MAPPAPLPPPATVSSPCVRLCTLDDDDMCVGCGRTLDDIRQWQAMPDADKAACVARARRRLVDKGLPIRTQPVAPPLKR
jgi:predicted Fe-S protein YdhL (DUF1289 family)